MLRSQLILATAFTVLSRAVPLEKRGIQWSKCEDIDVQSNFTYDCSTLSVPLDYTDDSNGELELQLLRIPAEQQPAQGSVLFNFGGPGAEGRNTLVAQAPLLVPSTGGIYDLIAFDPRGTANTIPFTCADSNVELYAASTAFHLGNSSDVATVQNWAHAEEFSNQCLKKEKDTGEFIGTAFVARDLMSVVDALDEDGMLRYWGFSYGSSLGATVAAMFPDRMDRIIIDAVQNVHEYYHALADFEEWTDSDRVFSGMWSTCIDAGPKRCPLAASWDTADELEAAVWDLIYSLKENPLAVGKKKPLVVDYEKIKTLFMASFYSTLHWPGVVAAIDKIFKGELDDELTELIGALVFTTPKEAIPDAITSASSIGIHCSDRFPRVDTLEELQPTLDQLEETSRMVSDITDAVTMSCARWGFHAKERYEGKFEDIKTQHPMLIIGNTWDAHTPLKSAHNASQIFDGSVVLEVNGYGHGSVSLVSECTIKTTAEYFVNGTLPEVGKVCPVDIQPYESLE